LKILDFGELDTQSCTRWTSHGDYRKKRKREG